MTALMLTTTDETARVRRRTGTKGSMPRRRRTAVAIDALRATAAAVVVVAALLLRCDCAAGDLAESETIAEPNIHSRRLTQVIRTHATSVVVTSGVRAQSSIVSVSSAQSQSDIETAVSTAVSAAFAKVRNGESSIDKAATSAGKETASLYANERAQACVQSAQGKEPPSYAQGDSGEVDAVDLAAAVSKAVAKVSNGNEVALDATSQAVLAGKFAGAEATAFAVAESRGGLTLACKDSIEAGVAIPITDALKQALNAVFPEGLSDEDEGIERPSTVFTQTTNSTSALGDVTTDGHDVSHVVRDENDGTEHSSSVFTQTTSTTSTVGDLPTAGRTDSTTSASQTQSDCHFRSPLACCLFGHTEHCK